MASGSDNIENDTETTTNSGKRERTYLGLDDLGALERERVLLVGCALHCVFFGKHCVCEVVIR